MKFAAYSTAASPPRRARWLTGLVLVLAVAAVTWAMVYHKTWLAAYWLQCLHSAPEEEVPALIACLGGLEGDGLPALVACLGSSRQVVREQALAFLKEQIRTWEARPEDAGNWHRLADALAQSAPVFRGWASQQSAVLAEMLLRARLPAHVDRMQLAASCKEVFHHSRGEQDTTTRNRLPLAAALGHTDRPLGHAPADAATDTVSEAADASPADTATQAANEPRRLTAALGNSGTRLQLPGASGAAQGSTLGTLPADRYLLGEEENEVATAVWEDRSALAAMDTAEVLSLFREIHPQAQEAAQRELSRRGFRDHHVELARHLADPNPAVRQQWVEQLPRMASIDPRPWLWWLTTDDNVEVRYAAYSLLATSSDLSTRRRLVETARSDPDPRIQALGVKLSADR